MADDGDAVQVGNRQVILPQELLQQPDQSAENTEVGCTTVGHQLVVALRRHTPPQQMVGGKTTILA